MLANGEGALGGVSADNNAVAAVEFCLIEAVDDEVCTVIDTDNEWSISINSELYDSVTRTVRVVAIDSAGNRSLPLTVHTAPRRRGTGTDRLCRYRL